MGGIRNNTRVVAANNPAKEVSADAWNDQLSVYDLSIEGVISPTQLAATVNDFNPTGWNDAAYNAKATILRVSSDHLYRRIGGLAGGRKGRIAILTNVGLYPIDVLREAAGSTAANRFALPENICVWPDESLGLWYDDTSARWRYLFHSVPRNDLDGHDYADDFTTGSIETGEYGWAGLSASGNLGTHAQQAGTANNPGIMRLLTGASSGNQARFHFGNGQATAEMLFQHSQLFRCIHRSTDRTTSVTRVGVGQDVSSTTFGTDGIWVETTNGGNWLAFARNNAVSTSQTDSGVAATANNWFKHDFFRRSDGQWEVYQNETRLVTYSSSQGPRDSIGAVRGGCVTTNTTAGRNIELDYVRVRAGVFTGQRWT